MEELIQNELQADVATIYDPAPEGNHLARCIGLVFLGTHTTEFAGKPGKPRKRVMLTWELSEEQKVFDELKGPQPYFVSNVYSLLISDKSVYAQHMKKWTKGNIDTNFDVSTMVGKPCLIDIEHKESKTQPGQMRARITGVSALVKGQICPERISPIKILTFNNWDESLFSEQSEWVQKMIETSPEYKILKGDKFAADNREGKFTDE